MKRETGNGRPKGSTEKDELGLESLDDALRGFVGALLG